MDNLGSSPPSSSALFMSHTSRSDESDPAGSNECWLKRKPEDYDSDEIARYEVENMIYERLGSHPRIVKYFGRSEEGMLLECHPRGNLHDYLETYRDEIPLPTRLQFAADIIEALAHMHSRGVVWVDGQFSNMLLTDDLRVVCCDFGGSAVLPQHNSSIFPGFLWFTFRAHKGYSFVEDQDRYAFGIALFVLLGMRWPHCPTLDCSGSLGDIAVERQRAENFDTGITEAEYPILATVIQKCWRLEYKSTTDLVADVHAGREACLTKAEHVSNPGIPKLCSI